MPSNYDYYKETRSIFEGLKNLGQRRWVDLINRKIEAGTTATKILMGLRWALQGCLKARGSELGDVEKRMLRLVSEIDGALK